MVHDLLVVLLSLLATVGLSGFLKPPYLQVTSGEERPGDYEVTEISETTWRTGWKSLVFKAFGETYNLHLHPSHLLAPQAVVVKRKVEAGGGGFKEVPRSKLKAVEEDPECHFLMHSNNVVAALDLCSEGEVSGVIVTKSHAVMELLPHRSYMVPDWNSEQVEIRNKTISSGHHLVRRVKPPRPGWEEEDEQDMVETGRMIEHSSLLLQHSNETKKVLEIAVFLDATAYKRFSEYFRKVGAENVDLEVKHLLLSYINGIQALYLLPSLGQGLTISIVRLELATERDPYESHAGDREQILASFCEYQSSLNPSQKGGPGGWDAAVLVTGLDLHEAGANDKGVTLGLSPVGGVCSHSHNCVVGELGVEGRRGQPQPSAGFAAIYVMAHELGHNLGMLHDDKAGCARDGFIMSPTRGSTGETEWSKCSAELLKEGVGHSCLLTEEGQGGDGPRLDENLLPGQIWSPAAQCQIFLLLPSAMPFKNQLPAQRCQTIKCSRPGRRGYQRAGPALEGTECGERLWCRSGKCVTKDNPSRPPVATTMGTPTNSTTTTPTSSTDTILPSITNKPLVSTTKTTITQRPGQTTTTKPSSQIETITMTVASRIPLLSCQPISQHDQVEGMVAWYEAMVAWCDHNCNHDPAHCPQSHCKCVLLES